MKRSKKLLLEMSEHRQKLATLGAKSEKGETLSDAEQTEQREALDQLPKKEVEYRAAVESEESRVPTPGEAERKEWEGLEERSSLTAVFASALTGNTIPEGAPESELRQEMGLTEQDIPPVLIAPRPTPEERADVVTPATNVIGTSMDRALARMFKDSDADYLGVRTVFQEHGKRGFPILAGDVNVGFKGKGTAIESKANSFTSKIPAASRLTGRFSMAVEDIQAATPDFESTLRANMSGAISQARDAEIIVGGAAAPHFTDAFYRTITAASAASAQVTAVNFADTVTANLDGVYAKDFSNLRILLGLESVRKLATLFRGDASDLTALDMARKLGFAWKASAHLPAKHTSGGLDKNQEALIRLGSEQSAVSVVFGGSTLIRDAISDAGSGTVHVTFYQLHGFVIQREASYKRVSFQLDA